MTWQEHWRVVPHGRWTYRLIPDVSAWIKYDTSVGFHTTQILAGHGCFAACLNKIGKLPTPDCWYESGEPDTAEHHLTMCCRWNEERACLLDEFEMPVQNRPTAEDIFGRVMERKVHWKALQRFCTDTLKKKGELERERQRAQRAGGRRRE